MEKKTLRKCSGTFTDTDLGKKPGQYAHNENIVMTFCVPGAGNIPFDFKSFCTEKSIDVFRIFKGKDTLSKNLIGTYSGNKGPGKITISDSCVTFHFISDGNVACIGWEATWSAKVITIPKAKIKTIPKVNCKSTSFTILLDKKIPCDSLKSGRFTLKGNVASNITKITPINCVKGYTDNFKIDLDKQLNIGGTYTFDGDYFFTDVCDSVWKINLKSSFVIDDCPITVELDVNDSIICAGTCVKITAKVNGGNVKNHKYVWSVPGLSGIGPHTVCPKVTTKYKLTVSDGVSVPGSDEITIKVNPSPKTMADTTVCNYNPPFKLRASPPGGVWSGAGVDKIAGTYDPKKAVNINRANTVYYTLNGCTDSMLIWVYRVYTTYPNIACVGANPFTLYYWSPRGGTWSGPNVTPKGVFSPPPGKGSYKLDYDWKGCKSTKVVNVIDSLIVQTRIDTLCNSQTRYTFEFSPIGGYWGGPARVSSSRGIIDPSKAGTGLIKYTYYAGGGCRKDAYVYITKLDARYDQISCSKADSFLLPKATPAGGAWYGKGVTDSVSGMFNPQLLNNKDFVILSYHFKGCVDKKWIYLDDAKVDVDTLKFCLDSDPIALNLANTKATPNKGLWSGEGITGLIENQFFTASKTGRGIFKGIYSINGCSDSLVFYVHPKANIQKDTFFCIYDKPFKMLNNESGGKFIGKGVTNSSTGIFNPAVAGVGKHQILFDLPNACRDTFYIEVIERPKLVLNGLLSQYCFKDQDLPLNFSPKGGVFTGNGLKDKVNGIFNPAFAGTGDVNIKYEYSSKGCKNEISISTIVIDTLKASIIADKDEICPGGQVELSAVGVGGDKFSYTYKWSSGQTVDAIYVTPKSNQRYSVVISDGCSDDATREKLILVHKPVVVDVTKNEKLCFGEKGFANIAFRDAEPYEITWYTFPEKKTNRVVETVNKSYRYTVKNLRTGCVLDNQVFLPGYDKVIADFSKNPAGCITNIFSDLTLFDHSSGAVKGTWYFGDGQSSKFFPGSVVKHVYPSDTNSFTIKQVVENLGGCKDSVQVYLCLNDSVLIFIPEIFSPDNFGPKENEIFKPDIHGQVEFVMEIYNRWGELIYRTEDADKGWDGTYGGKRVPEGIYQYKIIYKSKTSDYFTKVGSVVLSIL